MPKEPSPDSQMAWFLHHSTETCIIRTVTTTSQASVTNLRSGLWVRLWPSEGAEGASHRKPNSNWIKQLGNNCYVTRSLENIMQLIFRVNSALKLFADNPKFRLSLPIREQECMQVRIGDGSSSNSIYQVASPVPGPASGPRAARPSW